MYVYVNAFSLFHLRTWSNIWATISNSQTDRLTACNLKLGRVAAHNLQIARFTAHSPKIFGLTTRRLAACRLTTCRFAFWNYLFYSWTIFQKLPTKTFQCIRKSFDLWNGMSHRPFACGHLPLPLRLYVYFTSYALQFPWLQIKEFFKILREAWFFKFSFNYLVCK